MDVDSALQLLSGSPLPDAGEDGPRWDVVGDIHSCHAELLQLLHRLGYEHSHGWRHPEGRRVAFVGDLADSGPSPVAVWRLVTRLVGQGMARVVPGNHEIHVRRLLAGWKGWPGDQPNSRLRVLARAVSEQGAAFADELRTFLDGLPSHLVLDNGRLVVAHAAMPAHLQGDRSAAAARVAIWGYPSGTHDESGLLLHEDWGTDYTGSALVVHGHLPGPDVRWQGNTVNIDTGCVFGGSLSALRYPEREVVSVPALAVHRQPVRTIDGPRAHVSVGPGPRRAGKSA